MNGMDSGIRWLASTGSAWPFSDALAGFLRIRGSTTFYLESRSDFSDQVEVEVLSQSIEPSPGPGGDVLHRQATLYLRDPGQVLVVAESRIYLAHLPASYREALISRSTGIGKVLDPQNLGLIEKEDIETVVVAAPSALATGCEWAVMRRYRLLFQGLCCAEISEICNDESLARLGPGSVAPNANDIAADLDAADAIAQSRSVLRIGDDAWDLPWLLATGRRLWARYADYRLPALLGIDHRDKLALLLAALADGRKLVLCPPDLRLPAQCDIGIIAGHDACTTPPSHDASALPGDFAVLSSGTLGTPKLIWHRTARQWATARAVVARLGLTEGERILITVPAHHLYGLGAGLLPALRANADVMLLPRANLLNFNDALRTFEPQRVYSTPHLLRTLLHRKETPLPYCRGLISAGDSMPAQLHAQATSVFNRVHNLYGSSELGVIAISSDQTPHALRPLPGVAAFPAEPNAQRSSLHVIHPFPATHIDRDGAVSALNQPWDTRDVVAFAADGSFSLHGRADLSVNRAGKLVLLGELEHIAMGWPGVELAVAIALQDTAANGQAIALIVKPTDETVAIDDLKAHAARTLPAFARPDHYRIIASPACLASGKPDRTAISKEYHHAAH